MYSTTTRLSDRHKSCNWKIVTVLLFVAGIITSFITPPLPAKAQAKVEISYNYTFGQTAVFNLALEQGSQSDQVRLYIRTLDNLEAYTRVYTLPLESGRASYQRDLRATPFPPFKHVVFWWEYVDFQGKNIKTSEVDFLYEDNRFEWQTLEDGGIMLHWVNGEPALMVTAVDIAQAALLEIGNALQVPATKEIAIYIYPSLNDLQSALRLAGRTWVGAEAKPDVGVALLAIPASAEAQLQMEQAMPHELAHILIYQLMGPVGYENLPIWLSEGLATQFEQRPDTTYALKLQTAAEESNFMPMTELCGAFPSDSEDALLAYAQSQSFVEYLQQTYGWSRIRLLLDMYIDGLSCANGVKEALDKELTTLERDWKVWLIQDKQTPDSGKQFWATLQVVGRDMAPWLVLSGIIILPGTLSLIGRRRG
ncbi:MAG: hypothetical protein JW981_09385 [Anaerolineae bacterium]|nr:hypothetical protein [Anaerolineae bacterium]